MKMQQKAKAFNTLKPGTVAHQAHYLGNANAEPLIVGFDLMHRYAIAYRKRFGDSVSSDFVLGPDYLAVIRGLRGLLNGDGAVAMERGITTDSKDNGTCEGAFWDCMEAAGFKEEDLT